MEQRNPWKCDDGSYDICSPDGVVHQNVPAQVLGAAKEMFDALAAAEAAGFFKSNSAAEFFSAHGAICRQAVAALNLAKGV